MTKADWLRQEWQYRFEIPKLCYHPWLAADEGRVSHVLSHVVWWKKCVCVWLCVCVRGWVANWTESYFRYFETAPMCQENISLSTLALRPRKELCSQKPARPKERAEDVIQSKAEGQSVRGETPKWSVWNRDAVWSIESRHRTMKTSKHFW